MSCDPKDVIIAELKRTLSKLESTLRAAGSIEFQCYHNDRDKQLAREFLKMANEAQESLNFAIQLEYDL